MNDVLARYRNDPVFHTVVSHMRSIIASATLTPSEVREAAMMACVIDEMYRPRPPLSTSDEDLAVLRRQVLEHGAAPPIPRPRWMPETSARPASVASVEPNGAKYVDIYDEALRLLALVNTQFIEDVNSTNCFDLRVVERVRRCVNSRIEAERRGIVPPLLTAEPGARS